MDATLLSYGARADTYAIQCEAVELYLQTARRSREVARSLFDPAKLVGVG